MAGFTNAYSATVLDAQLSNTDFIAWSANGSSETGSLARTAVTAWGSAVAGAPATKKNTQNLETAEASGSVTVSHFAIYSLSSGGTQKTDWTALAAARSLPSGGKLTIAIDALSIGLN
jgi:hypothetical protein